jgi:putative inorganic carbon (HCO3(-)) transporter
MLGADEFARAGAVVGTAGLALFYLAPPRWGRLAGFAAWGVGALMLLPYLAPDGRERLIAAGAVGGALLAVVLAAVFLRWPWLVPMAALACVPARVPVDVGDETANLLLPLYGVVAGAACALGWQLVRGDTRAGELGRIRWPLAGIVVWTGLSVLWTDDLRDAAVSTAAFFLPFGLLAIVVARLPWSRRWLTALTVQLVAMAVVFAGIGGYQWITRDVFWNPKVIVSNAYLELFRVNSVFWDPSIYGRFLVLAILASLVFVLTGTARWLALGAAGAIAAIWLGLLVSFSQSSFVALMVGVLVAAAFAWRRRAVLVTGLAVAALLSVGFSAPGLRDALLEERRSGVDRATSGRFDLVSNGLEIALDHPAGGVGLGSFEQAYAARTGLKGEEPRRAASHNSAVTVAAENGVPGVVLLAWLLVAALAVPLRRASRSFSGRASLIVGLGVLAIAVHSMFYAAFFEDPMMWSLLGLAALVGAWRGSERKDPTP